MKNGYASNANALFNGYSLVTMEMTRRVMTNVPEVEATRGPMAPGASSRPISRSGRAASIVDKKSAEAVLRVWRSRSPADHPGELRY